MKNKYVLAYWDYYDGRSMILYNITKMTFQMLDMVGYSNKWSKTYPHSLKSAKRISSINNGQSTVVVSEFWS